MNLKQWVATGLAAIVLVGCGAPAAQNPTAVPAEATAGVATEATAGTTSGQTSTDSSATVARVGEVTLTRGELDSRIQRIQEAIAAQGSAGQAPSNIDIERSLVELFVNEVLVLNVANDRSVSISDQDIDNEISLIGDSIAAQGGTLEQAVTGQLGYENAEAPQFRQLISSIVARQRIGETLVTTDTVEQEVRADVEEQAQEQVERADVQHILFQSDSAETDAAALAKAQDAIKRLNNGEDFDALAKELSEDPGSKDNGGRYEGDSAFEPGQTDPAFDAAIFQQLAVGETTQEPVKSQFGYHVIRLNNKTSGPRYTAEQVEQLVADQVPQLLAQRRQEELQSLVDAAREKAVADGQLEEPTYPEPTPEAPGELPEDVAPAETPAADATTAPAP